MLIIDVSLPTKRFKFNKMINEVDDGIRVVESWLLFATEYIAIINNPLRPGVHVEGRSGLAQPEQSAGHARFKSQVICYLYMLTSVG